MANQYTKHKIHRSYYLRAYLEVDGVQVMPVYEGYFKTIIGRRAKVAQLRTSYRKIGKIEICIENYPKDKLPIRG